VTPELLNVIDDAIKILGPALITGMVGYYSASIQFKSRLKELDKNNEFKAREHFYNFYKEQRISSGEEMKPLLRTLSDLLQPAASGSLNQALSNKLQGVLSMRPVVFDSAKQGMELRELQDTDQYKKLLAADENIKALDYTTISSIDHIRELLKFFAIADLCSDKIMNENMNVMFAKYMTQ